MSAVPDLGAAALALATTKGLPVFPCGVRSKEPLPKSHGCKDATTDADVIRAWWQKNPNYNIGVATGKPSGVFIVDVDGAVGEQSLAALQAEHGALPETIESTTGKGRHLWFAMPPGVEITNSVGQIAKGIDIRGTGGYGIAPPSVHPSGVRYACTENGASVYAYPPQWLVDLIVRRPKPNGGQPPPQQEAPHHAAGTSSPAALAELARACATIRAAGPYSRHSG